MLGPFRHCPPMKHYAALALTNTSLGEVINGLASRHNYSDSKGTGCCKDIDQTAGMKVEPWPKPDQSPQPWRMECPQEPQPPNYDPYRIKVPETVVPPLPPCNAKRIDVVNAASDEQDQQAAFHRQQNQAGYHHHHDYHHHHQYPGYGYGEEEQKTENQGFLGRIKGFFGRLRGNKGKQGDGDAMMTDNRNINWIYR